MAAELIDRFGPLPEEAGQLLKVVAIKGLCREANVAKICAAYDQAIRDAGGVDLQILGIGTDGHIGFNEPGSSLASRTRIKTLTRQTRMDNARFFDGDLDAVPTHCLTQGLGTIMAARHLVLVATGALTLADGTAPERSLKALDPVAMAQSLAVNTIGPALVMKHFLPLLPRQGRCIAGFVSAKVGSIGDNALGGWYGYRASKAALNQLVKTAAIELKRRNPQALCVAIHPGTIDTALSQPFAKTGLSVRPPAEAAADLLGILPGLTAAHSGALVDYKGQTLPW